VRRTWRAVVLVLAGTLLAGCGVTPSGVVDAGRAPTGVAPGVTLYFVDAHHRLRPQPRPTGRLGSIADAEALLLSGPGDDSDLHTEIRPEDVTRVTVTTSPGLVQLVVPLASRDVTPLGIDQIVCTALDVYVRGGGPPSARVRVTFTLAAPGSDRPRTCPLIG
jgi:hypothetical protein